MKLLILATLISALIFLIIDVIWLSFSVKSFYRPNIGHLLLETPVMWAAILFYLIYVIGLAVVIIEPSLDYQNTQKFLIKAFMFGLVAYGTYNLTNMATIKGWSPNVVFVRARGKRCSTLSQCASFGITPSRVGVRGSEHSLWARVPHLPGWRPMVGQGTHTLYPTHTLRTPGSLYVPRY